MLTTSNKNKNDNQMSPSNNIKKKEWGKLLQFDKSSHKQTHQDDYGLFKKHSLIHNVYKAGRIKNLDINLNEGNTDKDMLRYISGTHFIIKRERITNYKAADCEGDFVVFIYDESTNGTFINREKIKDKRILIHNDIISIAESDNEVFKYLKIANSEKITIIPKEVAKNYVDLRPLGHGANGDVILVVSKINFRPFALKKLMEGGELQSRIMRSKGLPEKLAQFYFYQVSSAIKYLHNKKITHRDIKAQNVLLRSNEEYTLVKVTDFGLSKLINDETQMQSRSGTFKYMAPEIYKRKVYTNRVDVWSLGVLLYFMLRNRFPFEETKEVPIFSAVIGGKFNFDHCIWKSISETAKCLIKRMLTVNPKHRYSIDNVVECSWLDDVELTEKISSLENSEVIHTNNKRDSENEKPNDKKIRKLPCSDPVINDNQIKRPRLK
ncbi:ovarian-specific serine/threonine-protein kinase Lok-like [Aphidius gifuensis]|uniref:ovarian-specific serine/threonine-protein kinase Lok-like n=1 Tax=Aphidius gifuensis TaxID=684658 RepID=UPI001CDC2FB5|nr:ovarian-specific serine/threonine-protein kinase Lok-like [Aphidius gifuensis]